MLFALHPWCKCCPGTTATFLLSRVVIALSEKRSQVMQGTCPYRATTCDNCELLFVAKQTDFKHARPAKSNRALVMCNLNIRILSKNVAISIIGVTFHQ